MNSEHSHVFPQFKMARSDVKPQKGDTTLQKVDVAFYLADDAPSDPVSSNEPRWHTMQIPVEFKGSTLKDPFDDNLAADAPQGSAMERQASQGQMISYASQVFQYQHRVFLFSVIIMRNFARIIRWDRSGTVFTERFDYLKNPERLGVFFWRYSLASAEQRGFDRTAVLVSPGSLDYQLMDRVASDDERLEFRDYAREKFKESLAHPFFGRWKLSIVQKLPEGANGPEEVKYYLVGAPFFQATGTAGRGTRVFVAVVCGPAETSKRFVCLKDAWRVDHDGIDPEGDILATLNTLGISNVPTLLNHGDVGEQHTMTDRLYKELCPDATLSDSPYRSHTHYRMAVDEVCLPLSEFKNGRELVELIRDCFIGEPSFGVCNVPILISISYST